MSSIPRCYLCLLTMAAPCAGRITKASIDVDSRSVTILSRPFGFPMHGEPFLQFNVSDPDVLWTSHEPSKDNDLDCFRFYLSSSVFDEMGVEAPEPLDTLKCWPVEAIQGLHVVKLASFTALADLITVDRPRNQSTSFSYTLLHPDELGGGLHTLYFVNCCANKAGVSFDVVTDMHTAIHGEKSYLSLGEIELPTLYLVMCLLFAIETGLWAYTVHSNKSTAHRIHYCMIVLGAVKVLTLLARCGLYHYIRVTGDADGWNVANYLLTSCQSMLLCSAIALIEGGWSYIAPFLGDNEKPVLMAVLPLQVLMDASIVIIDEYAPPAASWFHGRSLLLFLDILCCCGILCLLERRIRHLHAAADTAAGAQRSLQPLVTFRNIYIMIIVYIYFTSIDVHFVNAAVPAERAWLAPAAVELATLGLYDLAASQLRPHPSNLYVYLKPEAQMEMHTV